MEKTPRKKHSKRENLSRLVGEQGKMVMAKKKTKRKAKPRRKSTVNAAGNYTKPKMRKRMFYAIKRGSKGGPSGVWSARKAQLLALRYRAAGGGYRN